MSLESDMLSDLAELLGEHGVPARWQNTDLIVLVSRISTGSEIAIGGYVESPDLSIRVPRAAFTGPVPAFGQRIEVGGGSYRIAKAGGHPRSPLLTLVLTSTDE
jgi:hypothetical protein